MDANINNLQDAMEWRNRSIRDEVELDDEMSNEHAIQLGFIQNMLAKFPRRNCDVGTADEQAERYEAFCCNYQKCTECPCANRPQYNSNCEFAWAQMPYEEGGNK